MFIYLYMSSTDRWMPGSKARLPARVLQHQLNCRHIGKTGVLIFKRFGIPFRQIPDNKYLSSWAF